MLVDDALVGMGKKANVKRKISSIEMTDSLEIGMMQELTSARRQNPNSLSVKTPACLKKIDVLDNLSNSGLSTLSPEKNCTWMANSYEGAGSGLSFGSVFLNTYSRFFVYMNEFSESEVARTLGVYDKRMEKISCIGLSEVPTGPQVSGRYLCAGETCMNQQPVTNKTAEGVVQSRVAPSAAPPRFPVDGKREGLPESAEEGFNGLHLEVVTPQARQTAAIKIFLHQRNPLSMTWTLNLKITLNMFSPLLLNF